MIIESLGLTQLFTYGDQFNTAWWYMTLAVLYAISVPIFLKLFKKYKYIPVLFGVIAIPRILRWSFSINSYIVYLFPLLLGIIFAEDNLMVKIANYRILKKHVYLSEVLKFLIGTLILVGMYFIEHDISVKQYWEILYGVFPVYLICYLYEFIIELPIIKNILQLLGKYSMNMFFTHEFLRTNYLHDYIYSFRNWIKILVVLIVLSLALAVLVELFKKLIRYDKLVDKLKNYIGKKVYENS